MPSSPGPSKADSSPITRLVFILPAMLAIVLSIGPSDLLLPSWWATWSDGAKPIVLAAGAIGLAVGAFAARPVWFLSAKVNSTGRSFALAISTVAVFGALVYLRESGLWPWPLAAGDALLVCASLVLLPVTVATERVHGVKVHLSARALRFVRAVRDA